MSLDASGSVAGTLTFAKWKGRPYVRQLVTPSNPKSVAQYYNRAMMAFLSQAWANLTPLKQATWDALAKQLAISPFNAFTSLNRKRWTQGLGPGQADPIGGTGTQATQTENTPVGGVRQMTGNVSVGTVNNGWGVIITIDPTNTSNPPISMTRIIVRTNTTGNHPWTISNLAPGTYSWAAYEFTDDGLLNSSPMNAGTGIIVT